MPQNCVACKIYRSKNDVSFFCFPRKDDKRFSEWLCRLGLSEGDIRSSHKVCSNHFGPEAFERSFQDELMYDSKRPGARARRRLKPDALPLERVVKSGFKPRKRGKWSLLKEEEERRQVRKRYIASALSAGPTIEDEILLFHNTTINTGEDIVVVASKLLAEVQAITRPHVASSSDNGSVTTLTQHPDADISNQTVDEPQKLVPTVSKASCTTIGDDKQSHHYKTDDDLHTMTYKLSSERFLRKGKIEDVVKKIKQRKIDI